MADEEQREAEGITEEEEREEALEEPQRIDGSITTVTGELASFTSFAAIVQWHRKIWSKLKWYNS